MVQEPLPLIPWDDQYDDIDTDESNDESMFSLRFYGYALLFASWLLFLVSVNTMFEIWQYVIYPLSLDSRTSWLYNDLKLYFTVFDKYIMRFWSIYIVIWWWSIISWCGIKLFRHSKGIQS